MQITYRLFCCLFLLFITGHVFGQKKDTLSLGFANGIVRDSAFNYELPSASLAIYKIQDSSLVTFQLSNNFGEFHFKGLPLQIPLRIVVYYAGYKTFVKKFLIDSTSKIIELKNLNLERGENSLKDVVVNSVPPVRMNGDTLEFNADAYKMDPNAQAEDWLRMLPGVTIWGDGVITVNGKTVSAVLVDGKPFMGGSTKVAIQNLPKNAIDKLQVYQQKNETNPFDSTTLVNIKLKKEMNFGHFGKLGASIGTQNRYSADAALSFFNPRTQLALVGATNNTNKRALDINTLLNSASYKGIGTNMEYQPDFRSQGLNQPSSGGFIFMKSFSDNNDYLNKNELTANYFLSNDISKTLRNTQTTTALTGDSALLKLNNSANNYNSTNQHFNAKYDFSNKTMEFYIAPSFNFNNNQSYSTQLDNSSSSWQGPQSSNNTKSDGSMDGKNITIETGFTHRRDYLMQRKSRFPQDYSFAYTFNTGYVDNDLHNQSDLVSVIDPSQNKMYDRRYNNHLSDLNQSLTFSLKNLEGLFFKHQSPLGISVELQNKLYLNVHKEDNIVKDKDSLSQAEMINMGLTTNNTYKTFNDLPALVLGKSFNKSLVNRYYKNLFINFSAQGQFYNQNNLSVHDFQNFERHFQKFVPTASINYYNNQYGEFYDYYNINYSNQVNYPNVNQLVPLVDSSNANNLQLGNPNLRPYRIHQLSMNFSHNSQRSKNPFSYNVNFNLSQTEDYITDSSYYDNATGRRIGFMVNRDGFKSMSGGGNLRKAFKFGLNQLQLTANTNLSLSKSPAYLNGVLNLTNNLNNYSSLDLNYSYKGLWELAGGSSANFSRSKTAANSSDFKSTTMSYHFSASVNFTKRFNSSSNITYNHNTASSGDAINFAIWNANISYRFLKGNNLEMKFSALDLLHQNTSIINYSNNNTITRGTVNVLQHYFMFTVAYYPRLFGKPHKEKK